MRLNRLAIVLSAALVPALASAQDTPAQPPQPTTTTTTTTTQQTTAPATTTTTPAPATTPVVVVNPEPTTPPAAPMAVPAQPEGQEVYDDWNAPVFTTGALVFAGTYGASAIVAASSSHPGADRLYVPVVGPWLALNDWGNCPITNATCDNTTTEKVLLVADGVFQAAGVLTMLDGIFEPTHHRTVVTTADRKVHVTPTHNGFAVFGHF